jgi:uroporphyrinogen decarboxylase
MNARERVIAAMEHRPVDRVPVFPVVTAYLASRVLRRQYQDFVLEPFLIYEALKALHQEFGFDGFEVGLGPRRDAVKPRVKEIDGQRYLVDAEEKLVAKLQEDDAPVSLETRPRLANKSDLDSIKITPASKFIESGQTEPVTKLIRELDGSAFVAGVAAGQTMNALAAWRGSDQAMFDLVDDPEFVHAVMTRATDQSIEVGKALIHAGVDGIYIGDAWASASIISPRTYEEFCLPYHRKAAETFQRLGAKVYLHICGNSNPILHLMAQTGVDAIEPLDVDGGVKLETVRERAGERVALKGGVSTQLLWKGTPNEVYAEARRCLKILGSQGYILGSADDIPRDTPFENIKAMVRTAKEA